MAIEVIKQVTLALKEQYETMVEPTALRDKVQLAYYKRVLNHLDHVLNEYPENTPEGTLALADALQNLLSDNWSLINGTSLSYTALPKSDVTSLLISVAEFVAEIENKKGCCVLSITSVPKTITELPLNGFNSACVRVTGEEDMRSCLIPLPSIPTDATLIDMGDFNSGYIRVKNDSAEQKLDALYYINKQQNISVRLTLSASKLADIDKRTSNRNHLEPLTAEMLQQFKALPRHPQILNALYYVNKQKNTLVPLMASRAQLDEFDKTLLTQSPLPVLPQEHIPDYCGNLAKTIAPYSTIKLLMPTVSLVSYSDDDTDLGSDITVLNTHVLGDKGLYLIPVRLLTELNLSAEAIQLPNPYFDHASHPEEARYFDDLDSEECKRLIGHSALTQAIINTKQEYELLTNDTSSLLGQLRQLCSQLGFNAVGRMGTEDNAGGGVYSAIIHFMEYYHKLDEGEKNKIPTFLKQEINTLFCV